MSESSYPAIQNLPGYAGHLSDQVVAIPELLRDNGYHTYMVGKWHLGQGIGQNPHDRGFEETFTLGAGGGSHWADQNPLSPPQTMVYTRNGKEVKLPQDFYSSRNYTDSLLEFLGRNKSDNKPFFAYLSYTAVHDPLHTPKEYIEKYRGVFNSGWDSLSVLRINNLKTLGLVPANVKAFTNPSIPRWESLSKEQKEEYARDMEVYAGMLDYLDMSIGRVFDFLKKEGMFDNTMIIFMSDNGANGALARAVYPGNEDGKYLSKFNNEPDNRGLQNSYVEMGPGWAMASSSPFRLFKGFTTEGGIKVPLIVKIPGTMKKGGQWNHSFFHVTDIMPTILELTGAAYPQQYKGKKIHPLIGKSLVPVLNGDSTAIHQDDGVGWELFEMKAYIRNKWKILRLPKPFSTGDWQLFDLEKDPGETTDLSKQFPEIRNELIEGWNQYAKANELFDHKGHYDSLYQKFQATK
jgi:arylsulfatase